MIIARTGLIDELDSFARAGHGLVTGAPGVGKTHSVAALHQRWAAQGVPHLLMAVDRLGSATDPEISALLGTKLDFVEFVEREMKKVPSPVGIVIFDGFDSARSETARERVLALIRRSIEESAGRWTVLVTVRIYDASRSQTLRDLFRKQDAQPPMKGRGVDEARHFIIPKLTPSEVESTIGQIPGLRAVADGATEDFRALLQIPFNLWLVHQILVSPASGAGLSTTASEVQLLGLYWERRVLSGDDPDNVRHLLHSAVDRMVLAQSLTVRREDVYSPALANAWRDAFSSAVLVEEDSKQQRVAFAHNILFDYAVSVLLLDDEPKTLNTFIAADPARPFFLRPSITYLFTRLWYDARDSFWISSYAALGNASNHVRLVGRIIPSAVFVAEARTRDDLVPLLSEIDAGRDDAREFLLRALQAYRAGAVRRLVLWAELCADAAARPDRRYLWDAVTIASNLLDQADDSVRPVVAQHIGTTGRAVLAWAMAARGIKSDRFADAVGALWAVPLTAMTYSTEVVESDKLLRQVLALVTQPHFPIDYLSRLSDKVSSLALPAPQLVGDIYRAVFTHGEEGDEETNFGTPILPMRSTRKQDFGMCEYVLVREFDKFFAAAPTEAALAALDCASAKILAEHVTRYEKPNKPGNSRAFDVTFRNHTLSVVADHSVIWLDSAHPDEAVQLLDKLTGFLKSAAASGNEITVNSILDAFVLRARVEGAWAALIRAGAQAPDTLGRRLAALPAIRGLQRTVYHRVGELVSACFALWSTQERDVIEESLEKLYREDSVDPAEGAVQKIADTLTACIPRELVRHTGLLAQLKRMEASGHVPTNDPPFRLQSSWGTYSNEDWLSEKGVDVAAPPNRELLDAAEKLEEITRPFQNTRADADALENVAQHLISDRKLLTARRDTTSLEVVELLATRMAAASTVIVKAKGDVSALALKAARATLLESARAPFSYGDDVLDRDFTTASWSPVPQTEAAQGLPWLAIRGRDDEVLDEISALAHSREPSVRYLTAVELFRLRRDYEDRFWTIVDDLAKHEPNRVVLSGLLITLGHINRSDADRIASVLQEIEKRGLTPGERAASADPYVRLLAWLALNVQESWAESALVKLAESPLENSDLTQQMVFEVLSIVTPSELSAASVRPVVLRGVTWLRAVVATARRAVSSVQGTETQKVSLEVIYQIIDEVAARLYFNLPRSKDDAPPSAEGLSDYFAVIGPLIEDVVAFGQQSDATLLAHTAHHIMELLHIVLPLDPPRILRLAAQVAKASERGGYSLDAMAVGEVVKIAEDVLANYRAEVIQGDALVDLVTLLDVFAGAGWPDALRVLWRLDEMFR